MKPNDVYDDEDEQKEEQDDTLFVVEWLNYVNLIHVLVDTLIMSTGLAES